MLLIIVSYQQKSRFLYTFAPNVWSIIKYFTCIFLKTFDSGFSHIYVWSTDQDSKPLSKS